MPELPSGWREEPLGEVAEVRVSNVDKKSRPFEIPVKLCNYLDAYREDYLDGSHPYMDATATPSEVTKFGLRAGDVLVTKDSETPDDIGVAAVIESAPDNLVCGYHLAMVRPTAQLNPVWLAKQFGTARVKGYLAARATGSTRYGLTNATLLNLPIFIPFRQEQDRIGEVLRTVDAAILHTGQLIAKLQQMKHGLLHDLLTRGIDESGELRDPWRHPEEFKDSPVGPIPLKWEAQPLEHWVRRDAPITYGIVQAGPNIPSGVPYIRTGDMAGDRLSLRGLLRTSESIAKAYKRSEVRSGEIVCAIRATVGKVLPVPQELDGANLTQGTARISPGVRVHGGFLLWAIRGRATQRQIATQKKGTTFQEITLTQLRKLLVAVPISKDEQSFIAELMERYEARQSTESEYLAKVQALRTGISEDLLTGRVRVTELIDGDAT